jgi:predicted O-methyltransferase YrrM
MSQYSRERIQATGYSREGFAEGYDVHRPSPPEALLDVLSLLAQVERPKLVVDLGTGTGTGLSTRVWAEPCGRRAHPWDRRCAGFAAPRGSAAIAP